MKPEELEFLEESNAIEGVHDDDSLQQAIYAWEYMSAQDEITPHDVLRVHKILMLNQKLFPDEKGYFRHCKVYIGGSEGMKYTKISKAIMEWCHKMSVLDSTDKKRLSKELHIEYEKIHPFVDGNGRTGRIFMNWWRIRNGLPILIIHRGYEQFEYYKWFN